MTIVRTDPSTLRGPDGRALRAGTAVGHLVDPAETGSDAFVGRLRTGIAAMIPPWLPVALILVSVPLHRPNILGEQFSLVAFALMIVAACAHILRTEGAATRLARIPGGPSAAPMLICLALGYLWLLLRAAVEDPGAEAQVTLQGLLLTCGSLLALLVVCDDRRMLMAVGRGFVWILVVLCASYALTAVVWTVAGVGNGEILTLPVGGNDPQPVYFPFSPTAQTQTAFGVQFPRFTGVGREPGWMAMYCAAGFFLAEMVGLRQWWVRTLMVVGLIGCVSTAGFGVFVVVLTYHSFFRDRGRATVGAYLRQLTGLVVMAAATWTAFEAPVLGFSAKSTQNATSLDDRQLATDAGLRALSAGDYWGGPPTEAQSGINLISDVVVSGLPFVLLVLVGLFLSMVRWSGPPRFSNAVPLIVLATMMTSQPARDSTWAFAVVMLSCLLRRQDADAFRRGTTEPTTKSDVPPARPIRTKGLL